MATSDVLEVIFENTPIEVNETNSEGNSALYFASFSGNLDTVKFLVKNGADVNLKNSFNDTPVKIAMKRGHYKVVDFLVSNGAIF